MSETSTTTALELGWVVAEIFHLASVHPKTSFADAIASQHPTGTSSLGGAGDLKPPVTLTVRAESVCARLLPTLHGLIPRLQISSDSLAAAVRDGHPARVLSAIKEFHVHVLTGLEAHDERAAVAYGLGRAMADAMRERSGG